MADVTIRLAMAHFSVEVTAPAEYAEKKLEELVDRYYSYGGTVPTQDTAVASPLEQGGKRLSAAEFLRKTGHKNQTDRGLVLGYYLERMNGQQNFTTSELGDLGTQTKQPFTNISDTVARLASRGLMMNSGDKEGQRAYALTASGEEYVESMMTAKA
jgi:hypothetical protein